MNIEYPKTRIGLHIGLPKTATTSLQINCFSRYPKLAYIGQTNFRDSYKANQLLRALLCPSLDFNIDESTEIIRDSLQKNEALMISDEALSMGQFMHRSELWPITTNHRVNAERTKEVIGDAHIFIVLRNQTDWLQSWHRQGLKNGKYKQPTFNQWCVKDLAKDKDLLFDTLNYENLYKAYENAFGKHRVHVYFYEDYVNVTLNKKGLESQRPQKNIGDLALSMTNILGFEGALSKVMMGHSPKNVTPKSFIQLRPCFRWMKAQRFFKKNLSKTSYKTEKKWASRLLTSLFYQETDFTDFDSNIRESIFKHYAASNERLFNHLEISQKNKNYF